MDGTWPDVGADVACLACRESESLGGVVRASGLSRPSHDRAEHLHEHHARRLGGKGIVAMLRPIFILDYLPRCVVNGTFTRAASATFIACERDLHLSLRRTLLLGHQVPQRQIVDDILHVLDPVLQPIATTSQAIVLEVENLEASMQVLDELVDEQRALKVPKRDGIASESSLLVASVDALRFNEGVGVPALRRAR